MSARKRQAKMGVHERLKAGYTNDAFGRWVKDSSTTAVKYAARANAHAVRNQTNRAHRAARRDVEWERALKKAKQVLRERGDTSEPLEWFVASFLRPIRNP